MVENIDEIEKVLIMMTIVADCPATVIFMIKSFWRFRQTSAL